MRSVTFLSLAFLAGFMRYWIPDTWLGLLIQNAAGCALCAAMMARWWKQSTKVSHWQVALTSGFCGSFTTFSGLMQKVSGVPLHLGWFFIAICVPFLSVCIMNWLVTVLHRVPFAGTRPDVQVFQQRNVVGKDERSA